MFIVSNKKENNLQEISNIQFNNKGNFPNYSPIKVEKKQLLSNYTPSFQTNFSFDSGKGSFASFSPEINNSEENLEIPNRNEYLGKKKFFKVNYICKEEPRKDLINRKKPRKKKQFLENENISINEGRWNEQENYKFLEAIYNYGNDWKEVKRHVGTRTSNQVRSHAQKFILKIKSFKDDFIGIDFTRKTVNKLSDIVEIIKEAEENNKNKNILILLSQKLSEKNLKFSGNQNIIDLNEEKNENKEIIKKDKKYNEKKQIKFSTNNIEKEKEIQKEEEENNKKNKNIILKKDENICETNNETNIKNEKNEKNLNENCNKENQKEDEYFFLYNNQDNLDFNNYEIVDGIAYNSNIFCGLSFLFKNNGEKELNTLSIINRPFYC